MSASTINQLIGLLDTAKAQLEQARGSQWREATRQSMVQDARDTMARALQSCDIKLGTKERGTA